MSPDPAQPILDLPKLVVDAASTVVVNSLPALGIVVLAVIAAALLIRLIRSYVA